MKNFMLMLAAGLMAANSYAQYTDGVFIVNEDWFGHNSSTVNFYSYKTGEMTYRAFQEENEGRTLGNTTQFAAKDANNIYFCSKQNYGETGGRFDVADAKTLKLKHSIATFSASGDTRACFPLNDSKVYVGTTKGVYVYNPTTQEVSGPIEGTSVKEPGLMELAGDKLVVCAQGKGVYVIDTTTDALDKTVDVSTSTCALFKVNDDLYVAVNNCTWGTPKPTNTEQFIKLDATTFEPETTTAVPMSCQNSSFAWKKTAPAVDHENEVLYYAPADGGNFISKYDLKSGEFTQEFITLPQGETMYGNVCDLDPNTGNIVVVTFTGYGSQKYYMHIYDKQGEETQDALLLTDNYWFPAMLVFAGPEVPTGVEGVDVVKTVTGVKYVNLAGQVSADPYDGINIVVTTYSDGSHTSVKKNIK